MPFAVPLAVLMAFFDLIPLVGSTIGGVLVALVTLFADFPQDTLIWVASSSSTSRSRTACCSRWSTGGR